VNKALAALDKFEHENAEFIAYYDSRPSATTSMKNVYISAYRKKDGSALLIIGNLSRDRKQGFVNIDSTIFESRMHVLKSWPEKQTIKPMGNSVYFDIDGLDYKMLVIIPAK
jgi:hypothetical protein